MAPDPGSQLKVTRWQRFLLPGEMLTLKSTRRSARDWFVDGLAFALAALIGALILWDDWELHSGLGAGLDIAAGVLSCGLLWWRRSRPVMVALVTSTLGIASGASAGASLVALFTAVVRADLRVIAPILAIGLAAGFIYPTIYQEPGEPFDWVELSLGVAITAIIISWGLFVRARRQLVRSLHQRADALEAEQRLHVEQARDAERRRIAREMHDVLAHRVSLLSVHAGALEFRPDAPPEEIAEAAGVIRATARAALEDLRDVIGVLREDTGASTGPPQPTLADLPALLDESRAAGLKVHAQLDPAAGVDGALGRTAYRIVQEGLTNARKHAPAAAVDVVVRNGDGLTVEVVSRRAVGTPVAVEHGTGSGTGLIGLAERVELAGGELEHGPDEHGDFVLRARLPA